MPELPMPLDDVSVGDWIGPRLGPRTGTVGAQVPQGFSAYARILHRIDPAGSRIRWDQVCAATGATAHGLMQWHRICSDWPTADRGDPLAGRSGEEDPKTGNLDPGSLAALVSVLSVDPSRPLFFGLWNGYGLFDSDDGPLLYLPGREYLLFHETLAAVAAIGLRSGTFFWPQSPNLIWPAEHTWFVATEIDFDSTLVGGDEGLIEKVLRHPDLEAWPVSADDSLRCDGDVVNPPGAFG